MNRTTVGLRRLPMMKRGFGLLLAAALLALSGPAASDTLTLAHAEQLALGQDPAVRAIEARERSLMEQSVAAEQLPDPMLKLGVAGLPTDSLHLGQEPMTQLQVGVTQKFPRGRSRALRSEALTRRAGALSAHAEDQRLRTLLAVREGYYEIVLQRRLSEIIREAEGVFSDLADITQDYYATGRARQPDVLRAAVELDRVRDRAARIAQQEDEARARLAAWIGDLAYLDVVAPWPLPIEIQAVPLIEQGLENHPRIRALGREVDAAEAVVELARQSYRPEFGVDLTYGGRGGTNPDGSDRTDLLSFMVTMDLPLFAGRRQDRTVAARVADSSAAIYTRDDVYRRMRSEVEQHAATQRRERERLELFETTLLPQAEFNAIATFEAYRAAVETLTTLMRARITEYELQLEYARLQAEHLKTRARLAYLQGEPS